MDEPELTSQEIYHGIVTTVREKDPALADRIEELVNEGKEIEVEVKEPSKKKPQSARRRVKVTPTEATDIALRVLQAHFIEFPAILARIPELIQPPENEKISIEREPAQALTPREEPLYVIEPPSEGDRNEQVNAYKRLTLLIGGNGETHADA